MMVQIIFLDGILLVGVFRGAAQRCIARDVGELCKQSFPSGGSHNHKAGRGNIKRE